MNTVNICAEMIALFSQKKILRSIRIPVTVEYRLTFLWTTVYIHMDLLTYLLTITVMVGVNDSSLSSPCRRHGRRRDFFLRMGKLGVWGRKFPSGVQGLSPSEGLGAKSQKPTTDCENNA